MKNSWGWESYDRGDNKPFAADVDFIYQGMSIGFVETTGLNSAENKGCHVNLHLYYDRNFAKTKCFASHNEARQFISTAGMVNL